MLLKDKSDYTHVWLDSTIMIKVFKTVNNRNPEFMRDIFEQNLKLKVWEWFKDKDSRD